MFFSVILILLIAIVFRKQKMAETGQQKSDEIEHICLKIRKNSSSAYHGIYSILCCLT